MNIDALRERHTANLARVGTLIDAYITSKGPGKGRATVAQEDLLRASVVFAHASIESLTRSLLSVCLPNAPANAVEKLLTFPLDNGRRGEKVSWSFFFARRGSQVQAVIDEAIQHYLDHFNLNHQADLVSALKLMGLDITSRSILADSRGAMIDVLMKRRHWIVHQLDANAALGRGHFATQSISLSTAQKFRDLVDEIGTMILSDAETELP